MPGERQVVTFEGEFREEVNVHGVGNPSGRVPTRPRRTRTPATTIGSMENEEIVEPPTDDAGIEEELLIEEISIDGMCGVY